MTLDGEDLVLFFDWDETITAHDTLALIAPPDGEHPGVPFEEYGKKYIEDLESHLKEWKEAHAEFESSMDGYLAYLESLDKVELASQKRIQEGGLFRGCDIQKLEDRARRHVELRQGWKEFSEQWLQNKSNPLEYHIISVGWSARFIAAALQTSSPPASICANEVEVDPASGTGTGRLTKSHDAAAGNGGIRIAQHKIREVNRILESKHSNLSPKPLTIFVGDSTTDLAALLAVDLGLVIGGKSSLARTIEHTILGDSSLADGRWYTTLDEARDSLATLIKETRNNLRKKQHRFFLIRINDWHEASEVLKMLGA